MSKCKIRGHQCGPYHQLKNRAEDSIRELKRKWKRHMIKSRAPKRVWDFGMVYESEILSRISRGHDGRTFMERITGDTLDISEWTDFEFYDLCWYWDTPNDREKPKLGRWLGVSHCIGSLLCYWILNDIVTVLARTTVQHVTRDKIVNTEIMNRIRDYHKKIEKVIGDDHYVSTEYEFERFFNEYVPDPREEAHEGLREKGNEDPYQGCDLPDIDDSLWIQIIAITKKYLTHI